MELSAYFKSIVDAEKDHIVICDTDHKIIYMNPAAVERYSKRGGAALVGKSILDCHSPSSAQRIKDVVNWFAESRDNNIVYTFHNTRNGEDTDVYMAALRDEQGRLIGYYEKHESRLRETMKVYDLGGKDK